MLVAEKERLLRVCTLHYLCLYPCTYLTDPFYPKINGRVDFSTLLGHHTFHLSLLGCAMEIVLYSFRVIEAAFPAILSLFGLHAFDLCKVIESVIRYETTLPRPVVHHLIRIEEAIVESLAWTDSSPLFALLADPAHRQALLLQQKTLSAQTSSSASSSLSVPTAGIPFSPGTFFFCLLLLGRL